MKICIVTLTLQPLGLLWAVGPFIGPYDFGDHGIADGIAEMANRNGISCSHEMGRIDHNLTEISVFWIKRNI